MSADELPEHLRDMILDECQGHKGSIDPRGSSFGDEDDTGFGQPSTERPTDQPEGSLPVVEE